MIRYSVYVVDDEDVARDGIALGLRKSYDVKTFPSAETAIDAMANGAPDLILLDIGLPGMNGIEALKEFKQRFSELLVIMITAYEDVDTIVSAMKLGAYDYVLKPMQMDTLLVSVRNALETIKMKKEILALQEKALKEELPCFIGESNAIQGVMDVVKKIAQSASTPVLIVGETGTGKELIASAIHYRSPNFMGPMVAVNCAAIPKELIESEMFGYEKGAFSGADRSGKTGFVEEASHGTLFLDEIGELSGEAQAKLLRFLEEGEYYKIGSSRKRQARTRIISTTNRNLDHMIEKGLFRKDLYYRIGVVKIKIPTLNQRRDDIIPIAKYFLVQFNQKFSKSFVAFSSDAETALKNFQWHGNIRELRNLIERAVLMADGSELSLHDLGLEDEKNLTHSTKSKIPLPSIPQSGIDFPSMSKAIEKQYMEEAIKMADGNETKAARLLGLTRDTYRYRRKKLGLL